MSSPFVSVNLTIGKFYITKLLSSRMAMCKVESNIGAIEKNYCSSFAGKQEEKQEEIDDNSNCCRCGKGDHPEWVSYVNLKCKEAL